MTVDPETALERLEAGLADLERTEYDLTLFVSGASDLSARAIANARQLCDLHLAGRHKLSVVDVHENLEALLENDVLATPTLVRSQPLPVRKVVGDLSHTKKVLLALGLPATDETSASG